ncbi:thiosulfate oxidation carrier protein SoxY [Bosea sp. (in: a-proteobacteria)]|uniref:thiosulfate oxidation carrier protein SoxY n=1 Tax=Bosea sp. (in: a-proteobacteria) TaxID=1871050 RepID=UPI001ACC147B|nr:thiosulfate oxidation carrier protein SoxY [Bosea sp. (in: a-proteobacteria)]MBN9442730.1 thiosulfate oxidation carrier protein SoxY [Bosea sp. (in: a-proteobacteria)]
MKSSLKRLSRRDSIKLAAAAFAAAAIAPRLAFADEKAVAAEIKKLYGDKAMGQGRIKLDVPEIAENGLVVPIGVEVESPMTDADYVKAVHVFADGNPQPGVVSYQFTPACGKASAATRMRLAQTQDVICIAEMSNGDLFSAKANVKVTIGGCGG